jgi:ABC-type bacteriocin/lantibiotic exporter with double-glycine peptidase domain
VTPDLRRPGERPRTVSPQIRTVLIVGAFSAVLYAVTAAAQLRWLQDSADSDASLSRVDVVLFVIATFLLFALFAALLRRFRRNPPARDIRILARSTRLTVSSSTA